MTGIRNTTPAGGTMPHMDGPECANHDPELWYNPHTRGTALHICRTHCPILDACKRYAHQQHAKVKSTYLPAWPQAVIGGEYWAYKRGDNHPTRNSTPEDIHACRLCRGDQAGEADETPCGTARGAYRHQRLGEPVDEACRKARNAHDNAVRRHRRQAAAAPPAEEVA